MKASKTQSTVSLTKKRIKIIRVTKKQQAKNQGEINQMVKAPSQKLKIEKCLLSGRPKVWLVEKGSKTIRKIQILPFNSLLIKRYEEKDNDVFIHSNLFANIFDRDTPYSQTQYHAGNVDKNKIYQKDAYDEQMMHPQHQEVNLSQFLKQLYMMYLQMETGSNNKELSQTIFYYDTDVTQLPFTLREDSKQNKNKKQTFLQQHEDYTYIIIFDIGEGIENTKQKKLIIYSAQNKGQLVSFIVRQRLQIRNNNSRNMIQTNECKQIIVTQNQLIVMFHKILFDKKQKEGDVNIRSLQESVDSFKKIQILNSQIQSLKAWSFTRQFDYSKFYLSNNMQLGQHHK